MKGIAAFLSLFITFFPLVRPNAAATGLNCIVDILAKQGFTAIHLSRCPDDMLVIAYENRAFRNEVLAAGVVMAAAAETASDSCRILLMPHRNGIPMGRVAVAVSAYRSFMAGRIDAKNFAESLDFKGMDRSPDEGSVVQGPRMWPLADLTIHPGFTVQFGNYDDPAKINLGLVPELTLDVWRGGSVSGRMFFPLYDELKIYSLEPRLVRLTLSQTLNVSRYWFFARIGVYEPDRWGMALEGLRFLFSRSVLIGGKAEYTGFFLNQESMIKYSSWETVTGQLYTTYFAPRYDLMMRLAYNKYLFSEKGPSFMISRKFADIEIGLLAAKTNIDEFGGIILKVPLAPQKSANPQRLRMRLPEQHTWKYESTSLAHTQGQTVQTGIGITSGIEAIEWFRFFVPSYIKNNISLWVHARQWTGDQAIQQKIERCR